MASLHQNNIIENQENGNGKASIKQTGLQSRTALSSIANNRVQGLTRSKSAVLNENGNTKQTFKFFKSKGEQSKETRTVLGLKENTSKQSFTVFCDEPVEKPKQKQAFSVYCDSETTVTRETAVTRVDFKPKEKPTVSEKPVVSTENVPEPEPVVSGVVCEPPSGNAQSDSDRLSEKGSLSPSESDKENRYKQPLAYTEESSVIRESVFGPRPVFTIGGGNTSDVISIGEDEVLTSPAGAESLVPVAKVVEDDSQFSEEYTVDIYKYLRSIEERLRPRYNYMKKQPDVTPAMRSILVDWLVEVSDEYKLHDETLHLAVSYIDRFLSFMSVLRGKLQLVGTAAMFIAAKYEEIYPPEVSEFVYITDDTYTKKQVLRMEHLILKVLAFDLAAPTPLYFLHRFSRLEPTTDEIKHLAMFLCQLTLLECDPYLRFLPSQIAASAFAIARHTFQLEPWTDNLKEKTGYCLGDLKELCCCLHRTFVSAPLHPQKALAEKFGTSKYSFVSQVRPRPLFHFPN